MTKGLKACLVKVTKRHLTFKYIENEEVWLIKALKYIT